MQAADEKNTSDTNEPEDEYGPEYAVSDVGVYTLLICGIILIGVGIYTAIVFKGTSMATFPDSEGSDVHVNGPFYIGLGVVCCAYPVYRLIRKQFTKK